MIIFFVLCFSFLCFKIKSVSGINDTVDEGNTSIIFGGDVSFSGIMKRKIESGKCTYNTSFKKIRKYFQEADEVVVNLENPVAEKEEMEKLPKHKLKKIHLLSDEQSLAAMKYAGINYVTVANNHLVDRQDEGIRHTVNLLKKYDIKFAGVASLKESLIFERKGIKFGLIAYCLVESGCGKNFTGIKPATYDKDKAAQDTKSLASKVDVVIVYLHWDVEYTVIPAHMFRFFEIIHTLSENVDVIIGSHAHVTQPHFIYRNTLVVPQIGNLLFPLHFSSFFVFDRDDMKNDPQLDDYEDWWYEYTKRFKNKSAYSRLFKLVFNRSGLVKEECRYMDAVNDVNKDHCLFIDPVMRQSSSPPSPWRRICDHKDENCIGVDECNPFECTLPPNKNSSKRIIRYKKKMWSQMEEAPRH